MESKNASFRRRNHHDTAKTRLLEVPLAMELQTVDDLVDHLALGAHRDADEIEIGALNRPHRFAIGGIVRGLEHVLGVKGRRHIARERTVERA